MLANVAHALDYSRDASAQPARHAEAAANIVTLTGAGEARWADAALQNVTPGSNFPSALSVIYGHFHPRRHLVDAHYFREARTGAFVVWKQETCVQRMG
jgi:hypothetical protein